MFPCYHGSWTQLSAITVTAGLDSATEGPGRRLLCLMHRKPRAGFKEVCRGFNGASNVFRFLQRNPVLSENKGPGGIISRKKPRTCLVGKGAAEIVMSRCTASFQAKLTATSAH